MNTFARAFQLGFAVTALIFAGGCDVGPTESDESSESEEVDDLYQEEGELDTDDVDSEAQLICVPQKMPICDSSQTLVCEGAGMCRRCKCSYF